MNNKIRLDKYLVDKCNIRSRAIAQNLIVSQKIKVNENLILKSNYLVSESDKIDIIDNEKYVSRGAYKLLSAIEIFKVNLKDKIVLDIGSSTGGFAQVLLENNVQKIYCLDVGTNQLHPLLLNNKKIINYEKTNFKDTNIEMFNDVNFITCDVSFISIKKILEKINSLKIKNISGIFLLKPQFELGPKEISEGSGKVNKKYLSKVIVEFKQFCQFNNFAIKNIIESPITGAKKNNIEYLVYLEW